MSERKPGAGGPKRWPLGLIGAAIVLPVVLFAAFVILYRVL